VDGGRLVANRHPSAHAAHTDFYLALRDAFRAAKRELDTRAEKRRLDVKRHSLPNLPPAASPIRGKDAA